MPVFIDRVEHGAGVRYTIPNPTTQGENFAEKWNHHSALAQAFYSWLDLAKSDLRRLEEQSGDDVPQQFFGQAIGIDEARRVFAMKADPFGKNERHSERLSNDRSRQYLKALIRKFLASFAH